MEKLWLDCECYDMDHAFRVWYDPEDKSFSFEFKIVRFGGDCPSTFMMHWWSGLHHKYKQVKAYLENLWWALNGRPSWYTAYAEISSKEMLRLEKFIKACAKKKRG